MFNLTLSNNNGHSETFQFNVHKTKIAQKWFNELKKDYPIYEKNRLTNWPNCKKNFNSQLKKITSTINSYDNTIPIWNNELTQQNLNILHKIFEYCRGDPQIGTLWYNNAPKFIQDATNNLNLIIHEAEASQWNDTHAKNRQFSQLVCTFKNRPRIKLTNFNHFTFKWKFGEVYINYCEVGKSSLDIWKNKDCIANRVVPQTHYSADFLIKFGPNTKLITWLLKYIAIKTWLFTKPNIPNISLGLIPVASIDTNESIDNILRRLSKVNTISYIECTE